ncbi:MAG TPA: AAA family ATPase [Solirubrobacteraceae bacterium]|nr:AAA family ATPase [Solirubrobacteraceae bacterium]
MSSIAADVEGQLLERGQSISALSGFLASVQADATGLLVWIGGEAGVGKTSLLRRFCELQRNPARALWGGCEPLRTPRPLGPFVDIAGSLGGQLASLVAAGARPHEVTVTLLDALHGPGPTVLVLEDLHWADEATLDVLTMLAARIRSVPALVLASYRDDEIERGSALRVLLGEKAPRARRLKVERLSRAAVASLAEPHGLDPAELYGRTGGNPFFVTEVLATGGERLPDTVRDAVLARAARLSDPAQRLLDAVAIVPGQAELWLLQALAGDLVRYLDECLASGMLAASGTAMSFRHELARLAIEEAISPVRRLDLHRAALAALEGKADRDVARLAEHAEVAGDAQAVLRYAPAAAARAASVGAHREAAALYARSVRFADEASARAGLLDSQAREAYLTGDFAEAFEACGEALASHRAAGAVREEAASLRLHGCLLLQLGRDHDAIAAGERAIALLETLPPDRDLAVAYASLAELAMTREDPGQASAWGHRALELAHEFDDGETARHVDVYIGAIEAKRGDSAGRARLERTLEAAIDTGFEEVAAEAFNWLVREAVRARSFVAVDLYLARGVEYCSERDLGNWRQSLVAMGARADLDRGRWSDAAAGAARVLRTARTQASAPALARSVLALVRARRGDPGVEVALEFPEATHDAGVACPRPVSAPPPTSKMYLAAARAEIAWLKHEPAAVLEATEEALDLAIRADAAWIVGELAYWRWRAGIIEEIPARAAEAYTLSIRGDWRRAAECWTELGCPYEAALALADGDDEELLRRALNELQRLGARATAAVLVRRLRQRGIRSMPRGPRASTRENPAGLTARELDVLALLAEGLRNAQIAERLVVSEKTVDHHVSAILRKLDVRTRGEASAEAARLRLTGPT